MRSKSFQREVEQCPLTPVLLAKIRLCGRIDVLKFLTNLSFRSHKITKKATEK